MKLQVLDLRLRQTLFTFYSSLFTKTMAVSFTDNFDDVLQSIERAAKQSVKETAIAIRDEAQAGSPSPEHPGPYATGATMAGLYILAQGFSDYATRVADAKSKNDVDAFVLPSEQLQAAQGEALAMLVAPLLYDIYLHAGTGSTRAQPFMFRAAMKQQNTLEKRLRQNLRDELR